MTPPDRSPPRATRPTWSKLAAWAGQAALVLLIAATIFTLPDKPALGLDPSWRIAMGQFFADHRQFGQEVVFTYGPLGFLMGRTYAGHYFWILIAWQLVTAVMIAGLLHYWGRRLAGGSRLCFYAFFVIFGVHYEDALHMIAIALVGLELIRRLGRPWHWTSTLMLLMLAMQSLAKFTSLVMALVAVGAGVGLALWQRRRDAALRLAGGFGGFFLTGWVLCGQNLLNMPAYLLHSWQISQGYQEAMGLATPAPVFWKALIIIGALSAYLLLGLFTQKDRPRAIATHAMLGLLLFLNWKHGFVRADGHMLAFFYSALLPVLTYPVLLTDPTPFELLKRASLWAAGGLCFWGIHDTAPAVVEQPRQILAYQLAENAGALLHPRLLRAEYDDALRREKRDHALPHARAVIGDGSVDVIGHNQAIAIYNQLAYVPRPVFQSYSAYTPELARLNADFYRSARAPDFVLLKLDSLDNRLAATDDSAVLYLLTQRYTYLFTEKGFQLWRRNDEPFREAPPQPIARQELSLDATCSLKEYADRFVWVNIDLPPSLLGRVRMLLYKPPPLELAVEDASGETVNYRLAAPVGRAGFILNPPMNDLDAFVRYAASRPTRTVTRIALVVAPADRKYFATTARVELSSLTPSKAGQEFFDQAGRGKFFMFRNVPVSESAGQPPSIGEIDGLKVLVMHAPSEMVFELPARPTVARGSHGFLPGAYRNGNHTDGADFVVTWSDGTETRQLYRRFLDPLNKPGDRALTPFQIDLSGLAGGRLYFRTRPGPFDDMGWDWTAWSDIEIK